MTTAAVRASEAPAEALAERGSWTILFVMQHPGFIRNYAPSLRILAERGHRIEIVYLRRASGDETFVDSLHRTCPEIRIRQAEEQESGLWPLFSWVVRGTIDYIRYFDSRFTQAHELRTRWERRLAPWLRESVAAVGRRIGDRGVRRAITLLQRMEAATPIAEPARRLLAEVRPDVVLVTPLVDFGSGTVDYVRAARELGIPVGLCVASWDNLTNKGHVRVLPDRTFVWNEVQKEEAAAFHGIPPDAVVVTGAQLFDHWFGRRPARSREEFCRAVGLDPANPFVLFLGSTNSMAPGEVEFVERWVEWIRSSDDPRAASLGVLIRPHPKNFRRYLTLDTSHLDNIVVWPPYTPDEDVYFGDDRQNDFFESLYYSVATVGANTSALIEAAIVGRPVYTVRDPAFATGHDETLHYAYLGSGLVHSASSMDEHLRHLSARLAGDDADVDRARAFVASFVRPRGLDVPAAPILADGIEELAATPRAQLRVADPEPLPRAVVYPLARVIEWLGPTPKRAQPEISWPVRLARPLIRLWALLVVQTLRLRARTPGRRELVRASALTRKRLKRMRSVLRRCGNAARRRGARATAAIRRRAPY